MIRHVNNSKKISCTKVIIAINFWKEKKRTEFLQVMQSLLCCVHLLELSNYLSEHNTTLGTGKTAGSRGCTTLHDRLIRNLHIRWGGQLKYNWKLPIYQHFYSIIWLFPQLIASNDTMLVFMRPTSHHYWAEKQHELLSWTPHFKDMEANIDRTLPHFAIFGVSVDY